MPDRKFGWIPDRSDNRDIPYSAIAVPEEVLPEAVDLRPTCPPIYDQGRLGSCTAQAIAAAIEFNLHKQAVRDFSPSRLFIYFNEREMEGSVYEDAGAMIRDGIKSVNSLGVCHEDLWPYLPVMFAVKPARIAYEEAKLCQALQYLRVGQDLYQMRHCLALGFPFVFGVLVYPSFHPDAFGNIPAPKDGEEAEGGHAMLCVGYDHPSQTFLVRNSWGTEWGWHGYCTLPYEYLLDRSQASDFWTIRLVS